MKRFLIVCAAALAVLAASEQKASAWCKFNFSIGMNISYQGGGNCFLWGLVKTSPYPGTDVNCCGHGGHGGYGHNYQNFYYGPPAYAQGADYGAGYAVAPQAAPAQHAAPAAAPNTQQIGYYYYPSAGYYNAPSYWYGN